MARVHHRKARKDYPKDGIKKGDLYYYCNFKTGPYTSRIIRQKEPIKASQTTGSDYLRGWYILQETDNDYTTPEDCNNASEAIREIADECQEKFDNMPEGLQQGDIGQLLEERIYHCETASDRLSEIAQELEDLNEVDYENPDEYEEAVEALSEEACDLVGDSGS